MGTGIVANARATLPFDVPGLKGFCFVMWILAAVLALALALNIRTARNKPPFSLT